MASPPEPKSIADLAATASLFTLIGAIIGYFSKRLGFFAKKAEIQANKEMAAGAAEAKLLEQTLIQQNVMFQSMAATLKDLMEDVDPRKIVEKLEQEVQIKSAEWQQQITEHYEENVTLKAEVQELREEVNGLRAENKKLRQENAQIREENTQILSELNAIRAEMERLKAR